MENKIISLNIPKTDKKNHFLEGFNISFYFRGRGVICIFTEYRGWGLTNVEFLGGWGYRSILSKLREV